MQPPAPKFDKLLAANLAKAKMAEPAKPYFFVLVLKGGTSGKLLVDRLKIKDDKIGAAKKATGGSVLVRGVCYKEGGKLVFETDKPPLPVWEKLVKDLAKNEAGLTIEVRFILTTRNLDQVQESEDDQLDEQGELGAAQPAGANGPQAAPATKPQPGSAPPKGPQDPGAASGPRPAATGRLEQLGRV